MGRRFKIDNEEYELIESHSPDAAGGYMVVRPIKPASPIERVGYNPDAKSYADRFPKVEQELAVIYDNRHSYYFSGDLNEFKETYGLMTSQEWADNFVEHMEYVNYDSKDSRGTGMYTYKTVCNEARKAATTK